MDSNRVFVGMGVYKATVVISVAELARDSEVKTALKFVSLCV
jgi:hypothetical protein